MMVDNDGGKMQSRGVDGRNRNNMQSDAMHTRPPLMGTGGVNPFTQDKKIPGLLDDPAVKAFGPSGAAGAGSNVGSTPFEQRTSSSGRGQQMGNAGGSDSSLSRQVKPPTGGPTVLKITAIPMISAA